MGNYDVDAALRLLSPRDVYGEDEKGCCLCDCLSQVVQQVALFILRVCHYICGDHYWYTNSLAAQIVEQYYATHERTPYLDGRVEELYQALALRSNGDGTYADGIRHRVTPEVIENGDEVDESIESIENDNEVVDIEPLICPIAKDTRAWILLEDGFTYEKDAIDSWLEAHPLTSPIIGAIPSATLGPNYYGLWSPICPISNRPFQEPYYCVQDCYTYERSAIIELFEELIGEKLAEETPEMGFQIKGLTDYRTLHFYPNKSVFEDKTLLRDCQPMELDLVEGMLNARSLPPPRTIDDDQVRDLILRYFNARTDEEGRTLKEKIRLRREVLGLETNDSGYNLDLSHLDLSNMVLSLSGVHGFVKCVNFRDSNLFNCVLKNWSNIGQNVSCYFMNCNLQNTIFLGCNLCIESRPARDTFLNSDMKDAKWYRSMNDSPDQIKKQLKSLGALNTETITIV